MEQFVSEPVTPTGGFDASAMSRGEPGLPRGFVWREQPYLIDEVLTSWITSSPEGGRGEMYVRRHWYELRTECGQLMKIYCDRQAKSAHRPKQRWWLYTIQAADSR